MTSFKYLVFLFVIFFGGAAAARVPANPVSKNSKTQKKSTQFSDFLESSEFSQASVHPAFDHAWQDLPNLTAEQRSFATALTLSRFRNFPDLLPAENPLNIPFGISGTHQNQPKKSDDTENSRRILNQLSGYYEFMLEQAQGAYVDPPTAAGNVSPTNRQLVNPLVNDILTDDMGTGSTNLVDSNSLVVGNQTPIVETNGTGTGTATENGPEPFSATVAVGSLQQTGPANSTLVKAELGRVKKFLRSGFSKSKSNLTCKFYLKKSMYQVDKAQALIKINNWGTARRKVQYIRQGIALCMQDIAGTTVDMGQAYLQSADATCISIIDDLTELIFNDKGRASASSSRVTDVTVVDSNPSQVEADTNSFRLKFDEYGGARLRTNDWYSSGTFSAAIKCPSGDAYGTNTAFYLSTPLNQSSRYSIILEFLYNDQRRLSLNTIQNGRSGNSMVVDLGYDCSDAFHTYTIIWTPSKVLWYADKTLLRILDNAGMEVLPQGTTMQLYMSLWVTSTVGIAPWPPYVNMSATPFYADFSNVSVTTPTSMAPAVPGSVPFSAVTPFAFDYCADNMEVARGEASIKFKGDGSGGRWHTTVPYQYGAFSTEFKCAAGNTSGFVSSFYLSSLESSIGHDEIDFEWLGKNNFGVQTNFYVNGLGGNEQWIPLDFDCAEDYHNYFVEYSASMIRWSVDGKIVRTVLSAKTPTFPSKPMYLYGSIWNASWVYHGQWSGAWNGGTGPWTVNYRNMNLTAPI